MAFFDFLKRLVGISKKNPEQVPDPIELELADNPNAWALSGTWLVMRSTNVEEIRYLYDDKILEIQFKRRPGSTTPAYYQHFNVPEEIAIGMAETDSPGRYHWTHIRGVYDYVRLTGFTETGNQKPNVVRPINDPIELARRQNEYIGEGLKPDHYIDPEERAYRIWKDLD